MVAGELWDMAEEDNGKNCCKIGIGTCSTCCRPAEKSVCRNVCSWDLCRGTPTNPLPSGHVWDIEEIDNGNSCCAFGQGPCSTCCQTPSEQASELEKVAQAEDVMTKELQDARNRADALRREYQISQRDLGRARAVMEKETEEEKHQKALYEQLLHQRSKQETSEAPQVVDKPKGHQLDANYIPLGNLALAMGLILVCGAICSVLCVFRDEPITPRGEEPLLGDDGPQRRRDRGNTPMSGNKGQKEGNIDEVTPDKVPGKQRISMIAIADAHKVSHKSI